MKRIDFSKIKILVVERLKDVKKRGVFTRHANRLLSHRTYRHVLSRLELLCEENRVQIAEVEPIGTNKVCARCGSRGIRRDERFVCKRCGWRVDADYNAALNIRDRFIAQGGYGPLPESHLDISFG